MNNLEKFGFIAIVGRPNVGKSTLLNHLLEKKVSITSKKPQTTRHRIVGIKTLGDTQIAYIDTPGLHRHEKFAQHRHLNRLARNVLRETDAVILIVDVKRWEADDDWILEQLRHLDLPVVLAINKMDRLSDPKKVLPFLESAQARFHFKAMIPISAKTGEQLGVLEQTIIECLPESPHGFPPDQWTDQSDRFMAVEILREKLFRLLGEELPYAVHVTLDVFEEGETLIKIAAVIWVERMSQKAIVIGKGGEHLKMIATHARQDMELYFDKKVFLQSWVKVGKPKESGETE